ncbi:OadG family protein [Zunongwangia pacifica]|uniref:OadG family protein n=1 Tax=Zunongwangia pacifica TaxID=2911062 RepID=A0A9X1ZTQ4_9FLAO|nr:OadG family protein [Zunongwangia pacifica]MCL6220852.1 OadG family protein [Zunongwangia pacifica]
MENNLNNALVIMLVGMITVFIILSLVVVIGNLIIKLTNKYSAENKQPTQIPQQSNSIANSQTIAALVAAVDVTTFGKGKITNITKVSSWQEK